MNIKQLSRERMGGCQQEGLPKGCFPEEESHIYEGELEEGEDDEDDDDDESELLLALSLLEDCSTLMREILLAGKKKGSSLTRVQLTLAKKLGLEIAAFTNQFEP